VGLTYYTLRFSTLILVAISLVLSAIVHDLHGLQDADP
jgi:hypothetical protein